MFSVIDHEGREIRIVASHVVALAPHSCNRDEKGHLHTDVRMSNTQTIVVRGSVADIERYWYQALTKIVQHDMASLSV